MGNEIGRQMLMSEGPLTLGAVVLGVVGLTPGLPKLPFFGLAAMLVVGLVDDLRGLCRVLGRRLGAPASRERQPSG